LTAVGIVFINPNSTEAMTGAMVDAARAAAPEMEITGWTSRCGPPAIEGAEHGALAAPHVLDLIDKAGQENADGIAIGCFDDTALEAAARRVSCPVIGIGQAAFHYCALRQWRFGVVTTLPVSVPVIEDNITRYGLSALSAPVRASGVAVLDLERAPRDAVGAIVHEARQAVARDGAEAIVLGCAGMVSVTRALRSALDVPVIDPVEAAVTALGWAVGMERVGARTP